MSDTKYTPMSEEEIDAAVFKIVRANQDKPKASIMTLIKLTLPAEEHAHIADSLMRLSDRAE